MFGSNYWYWTDGKAGIENWDPAVLARMRESGTSIIRIGGGRNDMYPPTDADLEAMVKAVRDPQGMAAIPLIQVPRSGYFKSDAPHFMGNKAMPKILEPERSLDEAIAIATRWVRLFNGPGSTNPVRYWSIGNEMRQQDIRSHDPAVIAAKIHDFFLPIAAAMKEIDPNIKIFGPDEAWIEPTQHALLFWNPEKRDGKGQPFADAFDITGKVPGKDYYHCDGLSIHMYSYPIPRDEAELRAAIGFYGGNYRRAYNLISSHPRNLDKTLNPGDALQWGIGEFNAGIDRRSQNGETFVNGQLFADTFGWAATYGATFAMSWSLSEGTFGLFNRNDLPRPSYWHTRLMSEHCTGEMTDVALSESDGSGVLDRIQGKNPDWRVFANVDRKAQKVAVVILNHGAAIPQVTVYDARGTPPSGAVIGLNFLKQPAPAPAANPCEIGEVPEKSTVVVVFKGKSVLKYIYSYVAPGEDSFGLGPAQTIAQKNPWPTAAFPAPPAPTVIADLPQLFIHEGGTATLTLRLSDPPTRSGKVVVSVAANDPGKRVRVSPSSVTFTRNNWNVGQPIVFAVKADASQGNYQVPARIHAMGYPPVAIPLKVQDNPSMRLKK